MPAASLAPSLASAGCSLGVVLISCLILAKLIGRWADQSTRRGACVALLLHLLSLILPAFTSNQDVIVGGLAWLGSLGGPMFLVEPGAATFGLFLAGLANLCFLAGIILSMDRRAPLSLIRRLAWLGVISGAACLVPTPGRVGLLPGFFLWIASFLALWRAAREPAPRRAKRAEVSSPILAWKAVPAETRCAYCHETDEELHRACPRCGTALHSECWLTAERCPTLGCGVRVRRRAAMSLAA